MVNLGYLGTLTGTVDAVMASPDCPAMSDFVDLKRFDCDCPASLVGYGLTSSHVTNYSSGHVDTFAEESCCPC